MRIILLLITITLLFSFKRDVPEIEKEDVFLTSFFVSEPQRNRKLPCPLGRVNELYHNGNTAKPKVGDVVYVDAAGTMVFNGENLYYKIAIRKTALIDSSGVVVYIYVCPDGSF